VHIPRGVMPGVVYRADPAAYLRSSQPDQPQFEALRQKLLELRGGKTVETAKSDVVIIPDGSVLKFGVEDEQVVLVRKRLEVQSAADTNEKLFDKDVLDAVKRFQYAHGTIPDGLVGAGTRRMLNGQQQQQQPRPVGGQAPIDALLVNIERWRWLAP